MRLGGFQPFRSGWALTLKALEFEGLSGTDFRREATECCETMIIRDLIVVY